MSLSLTGNFTKITNQKKLLIKLDEKQYQFIHNRAILAAKPLGSQAKLPTWTMVTEDGSTHFIVITLDKYDRGNLVKFEAMLKNRVNINGSFKTYDFIPDGTTEQICGVNYVLSTIRKLQPVCKDCKKIVTTCECLKATQADDTTHIVVSDSVATQIELEMKKLCDEVETQNDAGLHRNRPVLPPACVSVRQNGITYDC